MVKVAPRFSAHPLYLLEIRSGCRLCPLFTSTSQDKQTSTSSSTVPVLTAAASWIISGHQHDPHLFAGLHSEDVEDYIEFHTINTRGNSGASVCECYKQGGSASMGMMRSIWICLNVVLLTLRLRKFVNWSS